MLAALIFGAICTLDVVRSSAQHTPESPIVQKMVNQGCAYLEGQKLPRDRGEAVLLGYAHYKAKHDANAPIVVAAVTAAKLLADESLKGKSQDRKINYANAVAVLLLAAVDPKGNEPYLKKLKTFFEKIQRPNGAFTYVGVQEGDTSQLQYALLAYWTFDRAGLPVDYSRLVSAAQWLFRVQDPTGGWPYLGVDPGPGKPPQRQQKVDYSMALAGGSSLLIAGDVLRVWGDTSANDDDPGIPGLPKAIKLYKEDKNAQRRKRPEMSKAPIFRSIGLMEGWKKKHPYKRSGGLDYYYYQLYTQERYESFIEIANGRPKDKSPAWYNRGVDELRKYQGAEGGWTDRSKSAPHVQTAFAILFLVRSTQKAIFSVAGGGSIGGQGFSDNVESSKLVNGMAEGPKSQQAMEDLLKMLEDEDADANGGRSIPEALTLKTEPTERATQLDRLERLLRGSRSWQARRVAAKTLGKSDEMRVVPAMIFALTDPDSMVKKFARDGLRFISRKFEGFGMPDDPSDVDVSAAQDKWREWYRTMHPGFVFLDE